MTSHVFQSPAFAKINLHLHITGRTPNGYHLLDSLTVFSTLSDQLTISEAPGYSLSIMGDGEHFLDNCPVEDNLVTRAVRLFSEHYKTHTQLSISLEKIIPAGGGLGGGSADAAATLILLSRFFDIEPNLATLSAIAARMGSDIVACLTFLLEHRPVVMRDTGNSLLPAPQFPPLPALLVKPSTSCQTPLVYKSYANSGASFSPAVEFAPRYESVEDLTDFLRQTTHNDLTEAAISVNTDVAQVLSALSGLDGVLLSRLSGSGSACFAIFKTNAQAQAAAEILAIKNPDHWVRATQLA